MPWKESETRRANEILLREKLSGRDLISAIALYSAFTGKVPYKNVTTSWLIEDCLRANKFTQIKVKRVMDVVLGSLFFVLTLPLSILCALIVKLGSKGPVFFIQERVGTFGIPFRIYKFRTHASGPKRSRRNCRELARNKRAKNNLRREMA